MLSNYYLLAGIIEQKTDVDVFEMVTYWLYIDGVGRPQSGTDPDNHGYSDYGSLGEYVVTASYVADIIFLDGLE